MKIFDTYNGQPVHEITIATAAISVTISDLGATVRDIVVADKNGASTHVALAVNDAATMVGNSGYMGSVVGRCGNRIGDGGFTLNGKRYDLYRNDGQAHLHGGKNGFNKKVFSVEQLTETSVTLACHSEDGEENYPGNLDMKVRYTVDDGSLSIEYFAKCDADTIFSPTNHAYFNLNGDGNGTVDNLEMQIFAEGFVSVDKNLLPTGIRLVKDGDPFDFRRPKAIGKDIGADDEQLRLAGGYDHNFCLGLGGSHACKVYSPLTGIVMDVYTDRPGVQFYSGNFLDNLHGRHIYNRRSGFCLETQGYPNAANVGLFPSAVLKKDAEFYSKTTYAFSVK